MKRAYRAINFAQKTLVTIEQANKLASSYAAQGYSLTLRQLYYRFVAGALIPNTDREYQRLSSVLTDARYAGLFDWNLLTDRTRNLRGGDGSMIDPAEVIEPWAYAMALWEGQPERVEVWVEKDALVDVVGQAASKLRVPYFSCRGYTSVSEVWAAAQRIGDYFDDGVDRVTILHLGDHDPSGIDMSRDIEARLREFLSGDGWPGFRREFVVNRIALNMDQVEQYSPPPNPAKITDSRATGYIERFGGSSWELDALEPAVLNELITNELRAVLDPDLWAQRMEKERHGRATLKAVKDHYEDVIAYLDERGLLPESIEEDGDDTF